MDLNPEIHFKDATDLRSGFLALDYPIKITCDNWQWLSPTHYIETQRYRGTLLEGQIRDVRSVSAIPHIIQGRRKVTRDKRGRVMLVSNVNGVQRPDWEQVKESVIRKTLECKFSNELMKTRLQGTKGAQLIDEEKRYGVNIGPMLEDIRNGRSAISAESIMKSDRKDYTPLPREKESAIAEKLMDISELVVQEEKASKIHPDIVLDAIYNLIIQRDFNAFLPEPIINHKAILSDIKNFEASWNMLYHKYPNLLDLIERIHKQFSDRDPEQKNQKITAGYIALFILWYANYASPEERALIDKRLDSELQILIVDEDRWYRNENAHIDDEIINTGIPGVKTGDKLKIINLSDTRFKVVGKRVGKYAAELSNMGGVLEKRGTPGFVFEEMDRDMVDKFIISKLSRSQKYKYLYDRFIQDKLILLNDTLEQLSIIRGKELTTKDVKFVIENLYNCDINLEKDTVDCIPEITESFTETTFMTESAKILICRWLSKIVVDFTAGLSKRSCDLFIKRIESVDEAIAVKSNKICQPEFGYNCYQTAFLRAVTSVALALHSVYKLPITDTLIYQSIYLILPQQYHIQFKKFINKPTEDVEESNLIALVNSFITPHGTMRVADVNRVISAYEKAILFTKNILDLTLDRALIKRIRVIAVPHTYDIQITDADNILEEEDPIEDELDEIENRLEDAIDSTALQNRETENTFFSEESDLNESPPLETPETNTGALSETNMPSETSAAPENEESKNGTSGEFGDMISEYNEKLRTGLPDTVQSAKSFSEAVSNITQQNLNLPDEISL